jgi:pimeloyl-ACP methyl ester carboxylesterase
VTEQLVDLAGHSLWTARHGSGEPLLLLPGMMSHHRYWRPAFLEALEGSHELIELDHRGTGASGSARDPFTISDLAADAAGALEALGVERATVLGFSMGGAVGLELALRRPQAVERLILGAPAVASEGSPLDNATVTEVLEALRSGDLERSLRVAWKANVSAGFANDKSGYRDWREAAAAYRMSLRTIEHQLAAIDEYAPATNLDALPTSTLVLHGTEDQLVRIEHSVALVERLPHAERRGIEGAGHLFFWERPAETAELIAQWVSAPRMQVGGQR